MKAMLLAAGRGARMRPLTDHTPKPLLQVNGKALIVWHLERLARAGFKEIVINHAWLGHQIESYLGRGHTWGVEIHYSPETEALETAGGIKKALPSLGDGPFLVMNADIWCDWPPEHSADILQRLTEQQQLQAWLLLVKNPDFHPKGDFHLSADGFVQDHGEPRLTFAGIGIYQPGLFDEVPLGQPAMLAPLLKQAMLTRRVWGQQHHGTWVDVGTPARLQSLNTPVT